MAAAKRLYVLGVGNIGCLVAHSLKACNLEAAGITLCMPRLEKLQAFRENGRRITVERNGIPITHSGFDSEVPFLEGEKILAAGDPKEREKLLAEKKVHNLIVTTKATDVVRAMRPLLGRIGRDSTVLLIHNGLGVMEEVNRHLFPDPEQRPRLVFGVASHGAYSRQPFRIAQAGVGSTNMGIMPREGESASDTEDLSKMEDSTQYLINALTSCPDLDYILNPYPEFLCLQIEKLAANAVINALTVVLNCFNGELLYNMPVTKMMRLILFEVSRVAKTMPELASISNKDIRFAPETLEKRVIGILRKTAKNISSTLQDIRSGKSTEIDYINGFIADKGVALGIPCAVNFMLTEMVHAKERMVAAAMAAVVHPPESKL